MSLLKNALHLFQLESRKRRPKAREEPMRNEDTALNYTLRTALHAAQARFNARICWSTRTIHKRVTTMNFCRCGFLYHPAHKHVGISQEASTHMKSIAPK